MQQSYLDGLNERQKEAVLHIKGPLMIIAGAGSGKTKVLTSRIAHLIHSGVDSFNILALTFTNKAVEEMKSRIIESLIAFTKNEVSQKTANFMQEIATEIKLDVPTIQQKSKKLLIPNSIKHGYFEKRFLIVLV